MIEGILLKAKCWLEHMSLNLTTGLDPEGIKLRSVRGLAGSDYILPGFWIWSRMIGIYFFFFLINFFYYFCYLILFLFLFFNYFLNIIFLFIFKKILLILDMTRTIFSWQIMIGDFLIVFWNKEIITFQI